MRGPGKYSKEAIELCKSLKAAGIVLIVIDGLLGDGMAIEVTEEFLTKLPSILRVAADDLSQDLSKDIYQSPETKH